MNTDHWITAVLALQNAGKVVVFTGAGISAESGIPTFRDDDGFWQRFPPEQYASWTGLLQRMLFQRKAIWVTWIESGQISREDYWRQ